MELSRIQWRKSSYSSSNGGQCVEVAAAWRAVAVRDSKDPDGPALVFSHSAWSAFIGHVKDGQVSLA